MQFTKLQFAPGINRETTAYTAEGGWYDGDKIRFRAGLPETIGGWQKTTSSAILGTPRSVYQWEALDGTDYIGVGTNLKYYIVFGGVPYDITPIRLTTAAGDVTFSATDGSAVITVTTTSHGAYVGDFVTFSGAVGLGGTITADLLNAEHTITSIVDGNTFEITLTTPANASDTGSGGSSVVGAFQISVGLDTQIFGTGWGAGAWSRGGWGSAATTAIPGAQLRLWSQWAYGEDLLICPRSGGIYRWDASAGPSARAVSLSSLSGATNTPTVARQVMVSERDRHTVVFGCDSQFDPGTLDPTLIRFSSQESLTDWDITSATNTAGDLRVGSAIVSAVQTKQQILVFTESTLHALQFIGPPFTFGLQEVSSNTSLISANAAVAVEDSVFWMGRGNFYSYTGAVAPLPCTVREFVFGDINSRQTAKICSGHNGAFSEVWWFYPSADSDENDRYVVYDYAQQLWYYGTLSRTAWADSRTGLYPVAASTDGYVYYHEYGTDDGSQNPPAALSPFIESAVVDLGEGDQFMFATRLIPDLTFRASSNATPTATMTLKARSFPGAAFSSQDDNAVTKTSSVEVEQFTQQLFVRIRGRAMSLRVESNQVGTGWRLGSPRLDLRTDGKR